MNPSTHVEGRPQSAVTISSLVVVNIIWWMIMIAGLGFGATHLSRCPVQPYIPIFLIVLGAVSLFSLCLTYTKPTWKDGMAFILCTSCAAILHLFSFCWFIAGTVWVYSVYPPDYTTGSPRFCHKTTYLLAFSVTTLVWVVSSLIFLCGCCFGLVTCCKTVIEGRRLIPNSNTFYGATTGEDAAAGDV